MKSSQSRDKLESRLQQWSTCGKRANGDNRILDIRFYLDIELILTHCVNGEHFIRPQRAVMIKGNDDKSSKGNHQMMIKLTESK